MRTLNDAQQYLIRTAARVDADSPAWLRRNTGPVLFLYMAELLARLGAGWSWVGKARGDQGKIVPPGFQPRLIRYRGGDVEVVGVSHDAVFWQGDAADPMLGTFPNGLVQFDVLTSANYLDEPWIEPSGRQAVASVSGGVIPAHEYRANNPPVSPAAVLVAGGAAPVPGTAPPPPPSALPDRGEMMRAGQWLHAYYRSPEGLKRPDGLWTPATPEAAAQPDWEGIGAWLFDVYLRARLAGQTATDAAAQVVAQIRASQEWRDKHPNG